ncbi:MULTISPECIES: hypothetical protein [unclassified Sulfurospirillum]|uniref:hypothetical protein n=1 Tax=unclassified Sulfurospirillum TaxID=2618290 RepID=UPI0025FA6422|nr:MULTISPECIES: hypothetical protein [unclassified Sulfurospirillum]
MIDAINKYSVNLLKFIGETDKKLIMQEGKGFEQDDKKVILDNVFRPTNHGIIKDEASITISDILSALKSK